MHKLLLPLLLIPAVSVAEVSVTLSATQGSLNNSFEMVLEAEQSRPLPAPDFSLLKRDFEILNNSKLSVSNFRNGKTFYNSSWTIQLRPRRIGELIIPAIRVGPERSRSMAYSVTEHPAAELQPAVFLETTLEPDLNYSRSAFVLSIRLFFAEALSSAELTEPEIEGVSIIRLGPQLNYQQKRQGRNYQVIEQRYALFPRAAGRYQLPTIEFSGTTGDNRQAVSAVSDRLEFEALRPPPEIAPRSWLAATELRVEERWSAPLENLQVGDTLSRTLIIEAHNVPAEWLPEIVVNSQQGLSIYPQAPVFTQDSDTGTLVSRRETEYRLLLTSAGQLRLPALEVSWWDTIRDQQEVSRLGPVVFDVSPFTAGSIDKPASAAGSAAAARTTPEPAQTQQTASSAGNTDSGQPWLAWLWALIALICAAGWSLTRARLKQVLEDKQTLELQAVSNSSQLKQRDYQLEETSAFNRLSRACSVNDPETTAEELIVWARFSWPDETIGDLADVEIQADDPTLTYLLRDLEHRLYNEDEDDPWHGDLILNQISRLRRRLKGAPVLS